MTFFLTNTTYDDGLSRVCFYNRCLRNFHLLPGGRSPAMDKSARVGLLIFVELEHCRCGPGVTEEPAAFYLGRL